MWVALPKAHEEMAPAFAHHDTAEFPVVAENGKNVRSWSARPMARSRLCRCVHETLFADVHLKAGASVPLDADHEERAVYMITGEIDIAGDKFGPGQLLVFRPGDTVTITAAQDSHFVICGGAAMDGPRHIWWNFVSSSKDRIEQAKADWKTGHFQKVPGDDIEFIPLPEFKTKNSITPPRRGPNSRSALPCAMRCA